MATVAHAMKAARPTDVTGFDRVLAFAALALLAVTLIAVGRGHDSWDRIPANVWLHIATILVALVLTPVMLVRRRGDATHRRLGYAWVAAMAATALISFTIRLTNSGGFSMIHILSVWTLIQVPLIVWTARVHDHRRHRSAVRGMVIGALLIAGFFTFPFGRLMGNWLFG